MSVALESKLLRISINVGNVPVVIPFKYSKYNSILMNVYVNTVEIIYIYIYIQYII